MRFDNSAENFQLIVWKRLVGSPIKTAGFWIFLLQKKSKKLFHKSYTGHVERWFYSPVEKLFLNIGRNWSKSNKFETDINWFQVLSPQSVLLDK